MDNYRRICFCNLLEIRSRFGIPTVNVLREGSTVLAFLAAVVNGFEGRGVSLDGKVFRARHTCETCNGVFYTNGPGSWLSRRREGTATVSEFRHVVGARV